MEKHIINEIIKDTEKLVNIPSVKAPPEPGMPFGKEIAEALACTLNMAGNMGFETKNYDNFIGECSWGNGEKTFGILCHLDVMPAPGFKNAFSARVENGRLTGRGVLDDKCPTAAVLHILKKLKDEGILPRHKIKVIFGCDEESGWGCIEHYKKVCGKIADFGIAPDAEFPVINAEKGILHFDIIFPFNSSRITEIYGGNRYNAVPDSAGAAVNGEKIETAGISAHASTPEKGENAVIKLTEKLLLYDEGGVLKFISDIQSDGSGLNVKLSDEKSGNLTLNAAKINYLNHKLTLGCDIRYPVTFEKDFILKKIKGSLPAGSEIRVISHQPPLFIDKNSGLVKTLLSAYNKCTGKNEQSIAIGGGTYARALTYGAAFGPVTNNGSAHTDHEYMTLEEIEFMCDVYYEALKNIITKPFREIL